MLAVNVVNDLTRQEKQQAKGFDVIDQGRIIKIKPLYNLNMGDKISRLTKIFSREYKLAPKDVTSITKKRMLYLFPSFIS